MRLYILDGHKPKRARSIEEWARWMGGIHDMRRIVDFDDLGGVEVWTVFLGIDHAFMSSTPILFETMTFSALPELGHWCQRYATCEEARKGHLKTVKEVKQALNALRQEKE